ncbi:M3 family oligoendopeptidase [Niabella drilacis]|uniref:Oligoendopeptidase F n=1 Tax=Niabella drilacis (strain DSM 25811 / CCM 8410 / CCUG 62505 / LMG 26954 / E90) TaxID=1285928 RepID=A0A1G6Q514_NIADE|nr:M3 family oligoendopeptidase [Niabella drilacis]SDC87550.1 oligoendopeptidase F [Niabella drilacis]
MKLDANIQPLKRSFLPENFKITDWNTLEPYFKDLAERALTNHGELDQWLKDTSELEAVVSEEACWRQINMTRDTTDTALAESFTFFMTEIQPWMQPYADQLNRKLISSPLSAALTGPGFFTYLRNVKKNIELFREENIPLQSELAVEAQQFGAIAGKMTVTVNDREYTLQQAAKFLESPDRALRESVYRKIGDRRLQDQEALDDLFDTLLKKRHQVALNAGFENYRDYRFAELGRFDYSKENCFQFHEAVKEHVLPLVDKIYQQKKEKLGLEQLRPWDIDAEPEGTEPLRPFSTGSELVEKAIHCFNELKPFFGDCLRKMNEMGRLDLESRKGKAPGGYNCPLAETGAPFIFMNAAGTMDDVTTMVHEGGHAIHSFLTHSLQLSAFKEYPTEIAEVASMSMELFSMEHWTGFFKTPEELKRAHEQQLERVLTIFPWIATIDQFQHWIYEHPTHTRGERLTAWQNILASFTPQTLDTSGLEDYRNFSWQRQLHLYEVPFYYIEYGIAQLGAIGLWQQYKINKEQALDHYVQALSLGGTEPLPRLFEAAGLRFDLSPNHIKGLMEFVKNELDRL